jgi:hypothetical protein
MKQIELINLTLDEIRRSATMIDDVQKEAIFNDMASGCNQFGDLINECALMLETTRIKLRDVLENIAEFQNAKDMICPVDMALSETSYDLIYERKNECDFE